MKSIFFLTPDLSESDSEFFDFSDKSSSDLRSTPLSSVLESSKKNSLTLQTGAHSAKIGMLAANVLVQKSGKF